MATSYSKAKIDHTEQNNKCRLCSNRDETINHIISECSKLAPKEYKIKYNRVRKGIHRELCKKIKFDHTNKCYMHKPESGQKNKTYNPQWFSDSNK